MSELSNDIEYLYYSVKIGLSKDTGRRLVEEWYHDPKPRDDLKLHHHVDAARVEYHPETGQRVSRQYYDMGRLMMTVPTKQPLPEPER